MKDNNYDVVVVGGGLAGIAAAKAARDEGKSVMLLAKNGGATELSSGGLDVVGLVQNEFVEDISKGLEKLMNENKAHPYNKSKNTIKKGIDSIIDLAAEGGYKLYGDGNVNKLLPNYMGTFTVSAYVPEQMKDAIRSKESKEYMIVGFKGNNSFYPEYVAKSYAEIEKNYGYTENKYYSTLIELPSLSGRTRLSNAEIADFLDTCEGKNELIQIVKSLVADNVLNIDCVLFPPVLGYYNSSKLIEELRKATGKGIGELVGGANTVSGYRMSRALYKGLEKTGVKILRGYLAEKIEKVDDKIEITAIGGCTDQYHLGTRVKYRAKALVLATGGQIGGGISAKIKEVRINLLEESLGEVSEKDLKENVFEEQEYLNMGVQVDADMRVANKKIANNIFACGDLLAGFNWVKERSGAGVSASTGYLAGQNAAKACS